MSVDPAPVELSAWALPPAAVTRSVRGANSWTVLLSPVRGHALVLRLHRAGVDPARLALEHRILLALQAAKPPFEIPVPLPATDGQTVADVVWHGSRMTASLSTYIPGRPPEPGNPAEAGATGRALAQLHEALLTVPGFDGPLAYPPLDQVDELIDDPVTAAASGVRPASERWLLAAVVEKVMVKSGTLELPQQLIHADPYAANIVVRHGVVRGFLDFEFAGWGPPAMDVAVALVSLTLSPLTRPERWALVRILSSGYRTIRTLTATEIDAIPALLLLRETTSYLDRVGRFRRGEIRLPELEQRADRLLILDNWLAINQGQLIDAINL